MCCAVCGCASDRSAPAMGLIDARLLHDDVRFYHVSHPFYSSVMRLDVQQRFLLKLEMSISAEWLVQDKTSPLVVTKGPLLEGSVYAYVNMDVPE